MRNKREGWKVLMEIAKQACLELQRGQEILIKIGVKYKKIGKTWWL